MKVGVWRATMGGCTGSALDVGSRRTGRLSILNEKAVKPKEWSLLSDRPQASIQDLEMAQQVYDTLVRGMVNAADCGSVLTMVDCKSRSQSARCLQQLYHGLCPRRHGFELLALKHPSRMYYLVQGHSMELTKHMLLAHCHGLISSPVQLRPARRLRSTESDLTIDRGVDCMWSYGGRARQ